MKKRVGIIVLVLLLLILAGGGAAFYYYYSKYINIDAIYPGVTIQGMSVGGMTQEEAKAKVQEYVDKVSQETVTLQVKRREYICSFRYWSEMYEYGCGRESI